MKHNLRHDEMPTRQRTRGQSLVEMALILPILLLVMFGIMDMGYIIYSYATIYQSTRNAAEVAAGAPPYHTRVSADHDDANLDDSDSCVAAILDAGEAIAPPSLFPNLRENVTIVYPEYQLDPLEPLGCMQSESVDCAPVELAQRRQIGYPIEVGIEYEVVPLTPLWNMIPSGAMETNADGEPIFRISAVSRRSIEGFAFDPNDPDLDACER